MKAIWILAVSVILPGLARTTSAQTANGYVYDRETRRPIEDAIVVSGKHLTRTSRNGLYSFEGLQYGDTIKVAHISYYPYSFTFHSNLLETVYLEKRVRQLTSVVVVDNPAGGDIDSILFRREFSSVFNYKKITFKDLFVEKPLYLNPGEPTRQPTFNSLISFNLLAIPGFLKRNKAAMTKLQKVVVKDEAENFRTRVLFKKKVEELTLLKGDSLGRFLEDYSLSPFTLKEMNEYELIEYIKKSYAKFK